jgi:hydroxymethylpyrimidine pyrophosphatase-like HAD family hydrolase
MAKYFFFDIDHTLSVGITKIVPEDTRECLRRLRRAGHVVSLASGRLQSDVLKFAKTLDIHTFVADGGNSLTVHGELIEMIGLPKQRCQKLLAELDCCHIPWAVTTENETIRYTSDPFFADLGRQTNFKTIVGPVDIQSIDVFYKIFTGSVPPGAPEPNWQGLTKIPYFHDTYLIEPMDKASGIRRLVTRLGGRLEDVVVFGDGLNDLNMFSPQWFSIAMGNGCTALKEKADYVTGDCDKGGIMAACKKFGWI